MTDLNKYLELKKAVGEWLSIKNENVIPNEGDWFDRLIEAEGKVIKAYEQMED